ncbi:RNA polymerase sigma-70 factor, ECF subfamily [Serinicoccus hydrothermalis]|uniref:RNA polymerase sigma-70 factor, ECF subfamily n=1 Tax=Serinicoccus hydrothermalis TaxID=1758689 RepID=A0A1B1N9F1_9MICO|nr:RNA polymerase sigma-70 factor, ECF subfamily [Serinicoccus hydrothermalis]
MVREEWGRLVALLLARFRRLDLVEDALADAVEAAARRWPGEGVPDNPAGWLQTVARRRVVDRLRAETMAHRRHALVATDLDRRPPTAMADPGGLVEDDLLRLVLMCTHPALAPGAASALALRLVLGVSTHDIARLFLVPEPTMAARLTRAKRKIVAAGIPFAIPDRDALPGRLATVAQTAYLAFTAGYAPASGPDLLRPALAGEAVRLVRTVRDLRPEDPTLSALLALVLLQHSRRDARVDDEGRLVLLGEQDRGRWHRGEINEALGLLTSPALVDAELPDRAATYLLQALVAAEHATATSAATTRWDRVVRHYDQLVRLDPGPAALLARAVAVAEARGPAAGLEALDGVDVPGSHRVPAVRAELLARCGRADAALAELDLALGLCRNEAERAHLERRRRDLAP